MSKPDYKITKHDLNIVGRFTFDGLPAVAVAAIKEVGYAHTYDCHFVLVVTREDGRQFATTVGPYIGPLGWSNNYTRTRVVPLKGFVAIRIGKGTFDQPIITSSAIKPTREKALDAIKATGGECGVSVHEVEIPR